MSHKFSQYITGDEPPIQFNLPQLLTVIAPQKNKYLEWARGTGKSTILAWQLKELATQMPRGAFTIVGETYAQILTRTLPSTIQGLEMLGYKKDLHYFVGRKAPAKWKWEEPYQPPLTYDYAIHWVTGAVFHLVSMDLANGGRGLNIDGCVGDEAALLDYEKLFNNVLTTIRGNLDRFGKCKLHQSQLFASSVPMTNKGKWLFKMEEEAKKDPNEIFYLRADSFHNQHNLGEKWFKDNRRIMTDMIYNAEILNIRPGKVEGGFYPQFSEEKHVKSNYNNYYLESLNYNLEAAKSAKCLADGDINLNMPIDIALDYGAAINTIVAEQEINGESRILNALFVKSPLLLSDLINKFCDYYEAHRAKHVNYRYDHTAVGKDAGRAQSFADIVVEAFTKRGWTVNPIYMGQAPNHHAKYIFMGDFFKGEDSRLPKCIMNKHNCKYLILSINNAGVMQGKNGFEKDKRPEKQKGAIDEETTHFSDAFDTLIFFKYSQRIKHSDGDFDLPLTTS